MNLGRLARAALSSSVSGRSATPLAGLYANTPSLLFTRGVREWYPDPLFLETFKGPVLHNTDPAHVWQPQEPNPKANHREKTIQNLTLNFGPQHPAAHGVLRMVLTLDGETIVKAHRIQNLHPVPPVFRSSRLRVDDGERAVLQSR